MNVLVYHIVSGQSFFTGIVLIITGILASLRSGKVYRQVSVLGFVVGLLAVFVSSTAIAYWYYALTGAVSFAWIFACFSGKHRRSSAHAAVAAWLVAAVLELPYHLMPTLSPASPRSVTIIGDSVTAGIGADETSETWPKIFARTHAVQVQDISHMGETAASALKRARDYKIDSPVIIVEIGGNDLLGTTSSNQFARDLDALLTHVSAPGRQVLLFELPLPPFCHEYGRVQREIAKRHNVALVPKRVFLSVIASSDSTLDTIHLSQSGHQQMADCVGQLLRSAFPPSKIPK